MPFIVAWALIACFLYRLSIYIYVERETYNNLHNFLCCLVDKANVNNDLL